MSGPGVPDAPDSDVETLSAQPLDGEDAAILLGLGDLYRRHDDVPEGLTDRLLFGVALAEMEAELAELQAVDGDLLGARSDAPEETRTITFASESLSAMVTVSRQGPENVRIDGWIAPAGIVDVDLQLPTSRRRTISDADGRFVFDEVPRVLVKVVLRADSDGRIGPGPVVTPTFQL